MFLYYKQKEMKSMNDKHMDDASVNFAEYYSIDTIEYVEEPVTALPFSVRVTNLLSVINVAWVIFLQMCFNQFLMV